MIVDREGRVVLVDEDCRHCGEPSRPQHPGGVMSGLWKCYRCKRWQREEVNQQVEEN